MATGVPTGTVTFLFTDIEGSTRLAQNYPAALPGLLARHYAVLQEAIQAHHGHIFQIVGDAFCAAFFNAHDALNAALDAQRALQHTDWDPVPVWVRMGLHTGEAEATSIDDPQGPYSGYLTLTLAQRIMSAAHGGQVLLSGASAALLSGSLPAGIVLRDMGDHTLKGVAQPQRLWQLVAGDLQADFPPLLSLSNLPNNLPIPVNRFIGRVQELDQTRQLLENARLLTLIGPGGTGKTRLALQLAGEQLSQFPGGVWLVELAPLADPALIWQTVAATLGVREAPGISLEELVANRLVGKRVLLILDNCEHLIEACAHLADRLLRLCPELTILASSREALGIAGETLYRVPPLALPASDRPAFESLQESEAVQFFIDRASAVRPGFALTAQNAPAVSQICLRLDGIPLALELAAARVSLLTPEQIAARLDDLFQLLTGGSRTALPRQQTLRSTIDWSYALLSEPERQLFSRLAVFVGGCSLEAVEAIYSEGNGLELLTQLVQKSLAVAEERPDKTATRFRLLETIRQYARDRLFEMDAAGAARDLHLAYYLKFAEAGEPNFYGNQRLEWIDQCELEHDNFRAALQWGLDHDVEAALRLGGALATFWNARGFSMEGHRWLQAALDRAASLPELEGPAFQRRQAAQARGLTGLSTVTIGDGEYHVGLEAAQEAARLYRQLGDRFALGFSLSTAGFMAAFQGDLDLADQTLAEAIQLGRELGDKIILAYALGVQSRAVLLPRGDLLAAQAGSEESARLSQEAGLPWSEGLAELTLARLAAMQGRLDEARGHVRRAQEVHRDLRDPLVMTQASAEMGDLELRAGNLAEAQRYHQEAILAWKQYGQRAFVAHTLESFAFIAQGYNQPARAARLLGAAEALQEGIGTSAFGVERLESEYQRSVAWLRAEMDEATFNAYWSEGCAMSMDQAVAYALEASSAPS